MIPAAGLCLALAFYKVNEKPFINVIEAALRYTTHNKLYIWKKEPKKIEKGEDTEKSAGILGDIPKLSDSKLKELSWSLDIMGRNKSYKHE